MLLVCAVVRAAVACCVVLSCTCVPRALNELNLLLFFFSDIMSFSLSLTLPLPQGNLRRNDAEDKLGGRWKDEEKFVSEQDTWEAHQVIIQFNSINTSSLVYRLARFLTLTVLNPTSLPSCVRPTRRRSSTGRRTTGRSEARSTSTKDLILYSV